MPNWTQVAFGTDDYHAFCEYDDLLWVICSDVNPRSGKRGTIYNSATGGLGDWADEGQWQGPCDLYGNSYEGESSSRYSHLFVHNGYLHLVCNQHNTDPGTAHTRGRLYRRELDGSWTLIFQETDQLSPGYRYVSAESNGEDIILVGLVYIWPGTPTLRAVIWHVDGETYNRTIEYEAALLSQSDAAWRSFYSWQDEEWYACTDSTVRSRDGGAWPEEYDTEDANAFANGGWFYQPDDRTLWCGDRRRYDGVWSDIEHPSGPAINGIEERADGLLFVTEPSGNLWAHYTPGDWYDYDDPGGLRLNSLAYFSDEWFIAGANLASAGRIWRIDPDFDVEPPGGGGGGAGLMPAAMDVDGDGDVLYLGLYNAAGQPLLIRVPTPLAADAVGVAVFDPGAGDAINVQCTNVGRRLAIAGRLSGGGNDSVQVSGDGGLSWSDVADAWGDDAMPLSVAPTDLDEILVCLQTAEDIMLTEDGGTWVTVNAAIGYAPTAMAEHPQSHELVVGSAAGDLDYSPNRGQELADISPGFVGGVAALAVK
jgi:hypothetical protein